jgi:hypothetical protein
MHRALRAAGLAGALITMGRVAQADPLQPADPPPGHTLPMERFGFQPVGGPWLAAHWAIDGVLQDLTALLALVRALDHPLQWRVTPLFPATGGGGVSLDVVF